MSWGVECMFTLPTCHVTVSSSDSRWWPVCIDNPPGAYVRSRPDNLACLPASQGFRFVPPAPADVADRGAILTPPTVLWREDQGYAHQGKALLRVAEGGAVDACSASVFLLDRPSPFLTNRRSGGTYTPARIVELPAGCVMSVGAVSLG